MKQKLTLLLLLVTLFACTKEYSQKYKFVGKWEYEQYIGYPFDNTFQPQGNGKTLEIFSDGTFERRLYDSVLFRGAYSIKEKDDCVPREDKLFFSTNDTSSTDGYIDIKDNKLRISSSNCLMDGGTVIYRRLE